MKMLDANMILRFLLNDNAEMSGTVCRIIEQEPVIITNEVMAEVVYVLLKVYGLERETISTSLQTFLTISNVSPMEPEVLRTGLRLFGENKLDFVDCLLCAYHLKKQYEVCTFDKKLLKLIERETPWTGRFAN